MDILSLKRKLHSFRGLRNEDGDGGIGGSMYTGPSWDTPTFTPEQPTSPIPPSYNYTNPEFMGPPSDLSPAFTGPPSPESMGATPLAGGGWSLPDIFGPPSRDQIYQNFSQMSDKDLASIFANAPGWRTPQLTTSIDNLQSGIKNITPADWGYDNYQQPIQSDPNKGLWNMFTPGDTMYRLGFRNIGSAAAKDPFRYETTAERDDRMGLVGDAIGKVGKAVISAAMPAPISAALGVYNGIQDYNKTGDWKSALGKALGGFGGYSSAAGNILQGNYGSAVTNVLSKNNVGPLESMAAGIATDKATGKDVSEKAGGLGGYFLGNKIGGPLGGAFGGFLGRGLFGKK